ncbi:MAG: hypothetical protein WCY37_02465 [Candidatus Dojkabacteria bacterium]
MGSFFSLLVLIISPSLTYAAYSSLSFTPSTGTIYGDSTGISIYVDSGTDEYVGVDLNIAFTGSVEYVTGSQTKCSSFVVTDGDGTVNLECLYVGDGSSYKGTIATLYFKATGSGTSEFSFSSTDPAVTTPSVGTYSLSTSATPSSGTGDLPQTGLFDKTNLVLVGGISLLILGLVFNKVIDTTLNIFSSYRTNLEVQREGRRSFRQERRRSKLEKKF